MPFQYKRVLVIGCTSGIGEAFGNRLVDEGARVIAVGRRKEQLESFVHRHGKDAATAVPFDITQLAQIPSFVQNITSTFPDLDCIFINSGIQRKLDFTKPEENDLETLSTELTTNYISHVHLANAFLPFLQAKSSPSALIFVTSGLAIVPLLRAPNYSASKAATHALVLCLREQLAQRFPQIKIIEVQPPAVQTELHDAKHQPDIKDGHKIGMPLDKFTQAMWDGLNRKPEDYIETVRVEQGDKWREADEIRIDAFRQMSSHMRGAFAKKD